MEHQVKSKPRIIYVAIRHPPQPGHQAACTEEKYLKTRAMCLDIIADLKCLQKLYVFEPKHFDRDTVCEHLKEILTEYRSLRDDPIRFSSNAEYEDFLDTMHDLIAETAKIIKAIKRRDQLREEVQRETIKDIAQESNQRQLPHLPPWSQFLASGSPSWPTALFLPPFATRPPTDVSFPDHRQVSRTSLQVLPQAATGILAIWALEFQRANEFYHQRYPHENEFAGPLHRKLVPFRHMTMTPTGLKTEALRLHNLGNRPYAQAIEQVCGQGPEEKATLGRFVGKLERKDVPTHLAASRCYVMRRWVLQKLEPEN